MLKFTIGADISKDKINFALLFQNDFIREALHSLDAIY